MKKETFNTMKKQATAISCFGDKKSVSTIKKSANLEAVIAKIESYTIESIVTDTLNHYKPTLKLLPKEVRGTTMKELCNAIRLVLARENDILFTLDNNGNIVYRRILSKVKKSDNPDLFILLSNLLQDGAKEAIEQAEKRESDAVLSAYLDVLNECTLV